MKGAKKKGWALVGAMALVGTMASSAMAIEAFQERFEWGDLSKPTTLRGRVAVVDPYDKAVWINVAVFGGNAESGYYWQKYFPGKNVKMYPANDEIWKTLVAAGKDSSSQAVMTDTKPSNYGLVEIVVEEKRAKQTGNFFSQDCRRRSRNSGQTKEHSQPSFIVCFGCNEGR